VWLRENLLVEDSNIYGKKLDFFSKYLSVWVAVCIIAGTTIGYYFPGLSDSLAELEYANVSIPIAVVLLLMMYPIMLKVKFTELVSIRKNAKPFCSLQSLIGELLHSPWH
jgi:ACR3 family arsenite efflux pump ArsB